MEKKNTHKTEKDKKQHSTNKWFYFMFFFSKKKTVISRWYSSKEPLWTATYHVPQQNELKFCVYSWEENKKISVGDKKHKRTYSLQAQIRTVCATICYVDQRTVSCIST